MQTEKISDLVKKMLIAINEDVTREGLRDTPARVERAWEFMTGGYKQHPKNILKTRFTEKYNEIVVLKDIELYSMCEHHLLPFWGKCHIAYIPNGKVVGVSKLARLMECYARRLQIQERLCNQIVDAIERYLKPKGSACVIEAVHMCISSRGIQKQHSKMITSALRGCFLKDINARQELMGLIK